MDLGYSNIRQYSKTICLISILFLIILVGYLIPGRLVIPVKNATSSDWNSNTFWYEPWGRSGVHRGIDIFAPKGEEILSSNFGIVLYTGEIELGGKFILIFGPEWKLHYYAHLGSIFVEPFDLLSKSQAIGLNGNSGNAKGKQPHLHYAIISIIPHFWKIDGNTKGWQKMFYLNPITELSQ